MNGWKDGKIKAKIIQKVRSDDASDTASEAFLDWRADCPEFGKTCKPVNYRWIASLNSHLCDLCVVMEQMTMKGLREAGNDSGP